MNEPIEVPIYRATLVIHDDREPRHRERTAYPRTAFAPIPARSENWGNGHCRTVNAGAESPSFFVTAPAGSEVVTEPPVVVPRLRLPGGLLLAAVDLVRSAGDGLFGLSLLAVDGAAGLPDPFPVPEPAMAEIRAASVPKPKRAPKAKPTPAPEPRPRAITVEFDPTPPGPPVKRTQQDLFADLEVAG